jgi:hypothetical protein
MAETSTTNDSDHNAGDHQCRCAQLGAVGLANSIE